MRPTFMGFETATRSIMATQKALDIVNNNIGNIGVDGYTRQRVDLVSMNLNNRYTRYANSTVPMAGQGVKVNGVSQIRDPFLDKRFREEYGDVGYYDKAKEVLTDLGAALDEISPSTMSQAINKFTDAWKEMMQKGGVSSLNCSTVLAGARTLTQVFKQMDAKINNVWEQQKYDLNVNVNSVNSILERIANLNDTIKKEVFSSAKPGNEYYGPNELLDERNVLLDQLAEYGNIAVKQNADGTVDVTMGADDHTVVKGDRFDTIFVVENTNAQTVAIKWQSTGENAEMRTGGLKASLDMLNGRGVTANVTDGEGFEKGILYYKDKINTFAEVLAQTFNSVIPEVDADGNPTGAYKTLFTFGGNGDHTAGNIDLNEEWSENPAYMIENIRLPEEGSEDSSFAAQALAAFSKELDFGEFKGTFTDYINFYSNATLGNQVEFYDSRLTACSDISESLLNRISEISGVSMEEEGIDMMQYMKALQATSRIMTAMDEALDYIINKTGLVGR